MIPVCEPYLGGNEIEYVNRCLKDGWISSGGEFLEKFEQKFAEYCGCKYGIAVTSGTTALHLALDVLGIGEGDEVILPDFTIASCAFAVKYQNATPVFVDSEPYTFNIDTDKIESKITNKTKAIMPVHIYGKPAEMERILQLALDYGLYVVEDAAEAHGAEYRGKKVGGLGHIGCFSFFANKIISTGEGGMLVTNCKGYADKARSYRNLAHSAVRFLHNHIGFNYRMTNIQAAIGLAQLERIDDYINIRLGHAKLYTELLSGVKHLALCQEHRPYVKSINWMYCILTQDFNERRELMSYLDKNGVQTRTFFFPMHGQPMFYQMEECVVSNNISQRGLYLPSGTGLKESEIKYVCNKIKEFYAGYTGS